jgi:hypothetical protein
VYSGFITSFAYIFAEKFRFLPSLLSRKYNIIYMYNMCAPEARSVSRAVIFFFFIPSPLPPRHLTVLMSFRRYRFPGARGSRSAAHGDRRHRNPKRNWFPPDDYPSVGTVYTYIYIHIIYVWVQRNI